MEPPRLPNTRHGTNTSRPARVIEITQQLPKQEQITLDGKAFSMISLRLCWSMSALWCTWWGSTQFPVSTQITDAKFRIEKGIRYECRVMDWLTAHSMLQCAGECPKEKSCYGFNFGSAQCERLFPMHSAWFDLWVPPYRDMSSIVLIKPHHLHVGRAKLYLTAKHLLFHGMHCFKGEAILQK